ncbi:hypothetical protein [Chryseobacterium wangxinyae]|uniref:hypothetical protein n=1 Tax=Chryseobacterium sp. CY353 TaxID=2997334 RepID=UPI0022721CED|nr:hypothetical protein [Chryseobacterium sp. CY353]MCY0969592.1 hypothetical protein [Chryseobacterium sp. CY353]
MKNLSIILLITCLTSCFSTQYVAEKHHGNFEKVRAGNRYTILDTENKKVSLDVTSIEKDSIRGNKQNLPFAIAKNDIKRIRKNNTAGTLLIVGGAVAGVTITTVALINLIKVDSEDSSLDEYQYQLN